MIEKLFLVSDIHGEYDLLERLLRHWDKEQEQLVVLGDIIDRGPQSKACLLKIKQLVEQENAICLLGNHEDILLQWLEEPEDCMAWYLRNDGQATLESFFYKGILEEKRPLEIASQFKIRYSECVKFLEKRPLFYENDYCISVHAGINLSLDDWKKTSRRDCLWLREPFHQADNHTGKYIVFGHTPVQKLHTTLFNDNVWYHQDKIGIDGGAVYGGVLHGVVLSKNGIEANYQIMSEQKRWQ